MRGFTGCDFGPFGRHCQDMGTFGHHGPFDRFGCGPPRHHGHHFGPSGHNFGPPGGRHGDHRPIFERHGSGCGPDRAEPGNCCQDCGSRGRRFGRSPCGERVTRGPPGCPETAQHFPEGRGHGSHGPPCGRLRDYSRERSPHRRHCSSGPHGPCHCPPHEGRRHHGGRRRWHGSPPRHDRPCGRRDFGDESGPEGPHGHHHHGPRGPHGHHRPGPFDPHFEGHFGPHRRPLGSCNRQGPYARCLRNNSDEESGNETERRARKNRPCCKKNKNQNRDEAILVQRIVVEKAPRCNSV